MTFKIATLLLALLLLAGMLMKSRAAGIGGSKPKGPAVEAARKCRVCGVYVLKGAACARPDCPQG